MGRHSDGLSTLSTSPCISRTPVPAPSPRAGPPFPLFNLRLHPHPAMRRTSRTKPPCRGYHTAHSEDIMPHIPAAHPLLISIDLVSAACCPMLHHSSGNDLGSRSKRLYSFVPLYARRALSMPAVVPTLSARVLLMSSSRRFQSASQGLYTSGSARRCIGAASRVHV